MRRHTEPAYCSIECRSITFVPIGISRAVARSAVDGIILAPCSDTEQSALAYLRENQIPTVLVDRLASKAFDQVGVRNANSVERLVDC